MSKLCSHDPHLIALIPIFKHDGFSGKVLKKRNALGKTWPPCSKANTNLQMQCHWKQIVKKRTRQREKAKGLYTKFFA